MNEKLKRRVVFGTLPPEERSTSMFDGYGDLLTADDVAEITGQSAQTIRALCRDGRLPNVVIGRRVYVPKERLVAMVNDECDKSITGCGFHG